MTARGDTAPAGAKPGADSPAGGGLPGPRPGGPLPGAKPAPAPPHPIALAAAIAWKIVKLFVASCAAVVVAYTLVETLLIVLGFIGRLFG